MLAATRPCPCLLLRRRARRLLLSLGSFFLAQSLFSQEDVDDPVYELSPFEVDASDAQGYRATNSISATRLSTPIKDVPLNLEVVTSEFIRDTGAKDLREALRYQSGIILESQSDAFVETDSDWDSGGANDPQGATRRAGDSTVKMRGFVIDQVLRDGFRRQYAADSINIGRVEIVRGPSALLYGVGSFGGVVNYVPLMPSHEQTTYFGVSMGSHDLFRFEFDQGGPIPSGEWDAAYRVTGAYQKNGDHTEHYESEHFMVAPVFSFKPLPNTTVVFDNEIGYSKQNGVGFQNIRSNINAAASRTAGWLTDVSQGRIDNRAFRWSGPDTYLKGPFNNHVIDVTQKFGDNLYAKLGYSYSRAVFDSRQIRETSTRAEPFAISNPRAYDDDATVSIDGSPVNLRHAIEQTTLEGADGEFMGLSALELYQRRPAGAFRGDSLYGFVASDPIENQVRPGPPAFTDSASILYEWNDSYRVEQRDQIRFDLNYELRTGEWGVHNFILGAQYMGLRSEDEQYGPPRSTATQPVPDDLRYSFHNPEDYSYFRYGVQGDGRPDNPRTHLFTIDRKTWDTGYYAVYQGKFFRDRVTVIGGWRHDRNDRRETLNYIYETGREPEITTRVQDEAPTATSPQAGITFAINDSLSVFGLYSTGVVPNYSARDGLGDAFEPTKATNYEAGIKFDAMEGRLSGTVSAYKIKRENTPKFLWWAPSPRQSEINGYNPDLPPTAPWTHPGPDAVWYAIRNVDNGLQVAKEMFGEAWHPTLEAMAAVADNGSGAPADGFYDIPGVARWWEYSRDEQGLMGLTREAEANFYVGGKANNIWFPLVNFSDPEHAAFAKAAKVDSGVWGGNWFYTPGQAYFYADGSSGTGNAPDGSGADVAVSDEAEGFDISLHFSPIDNLQIVFNYARVERRITTPTYQFVSAPYWPFAPWYAQDGYYGTLGYNRPPSEAYGDVTDTTTYQAPIPEFQQAADDTPENSLSLWTNYRFNEGGFFQGLSVGLGGSWQDNRQWFTGFTGGGGNITTVETENGDRELVQLWTDERIEVNGYVSYERRIGDRYDWRIALNVDNMLDDQSRYGELFAPGVSWRVSTGLTF